MYEGGGRTLNVGRKETAIKKGGKELVVSTSHQLTKERSMR
jgi:hypothetical protein